MNRRSIRISRFEHDGQIFVLNKPLSLGLSRIGDFWVYENEAFNLQGRSRDQHEALKNLNEDFVNFYHEIALEKGREP